METFAHPEPDRVTVGVDTHKDSHVAVVKNERGRTLATTSIPTTLVSEALLDRRPPATWLRKAGRRRGHGTATPGARGRRAPLLP